MVRVLSLLIFLLSSFAVWGSNPYCSQFFYKPQSAYYHEVKKSFQSVIKRNKPVIVAHGKNTNIAPESTWKNMEYSLSKGEEWISCLEIDAQITRDGQFVVAHDPTFHRLMEGYQTPQVQIDRFWREHYDLAKSKEGQWDFGLFDEVYWYKFNEIKKNFAITDPNTHLDHEVIGLDEILKSIETPGQMKIPRHVAQSRAPPYQQVTIPEEVVEVNQDLIIYVDLKATNHLARRLEGLSDWHWIRNSWSLEQLTDFTRETIQSLSSSLFKYSAHGKVFITVRHPQVAQMVRDIDPHINFMVSTELVGVDSSADDFIREMSKFLYLEPELVEVKFLPHILDPKVRMWAKQNHLQLFFNQIKEVDMRQFEGIYKDDLPRLLDDLLKEGDDIMLQTNTVEALKSYLRSRYP